MAIEAIDAGELNTAFLLRNSEKRPKKIEDSYGPSSVGFCLERLRLRKLHDWDTPLNGPMYIGVIAHKDLPAIFKYTKYATAHGETKWERLKNWNKRPRFELEFIMEDPEGRGFSVRGFVDIDVPAADCIIEYKSTGNKNFAQGVFGRGDSMVEAYISQANAYAVTLSRARWELWILYKKFKLDAYGKPKTNIFTIISGDVDYEMYEEFMTRVWFVHEGIKMNKALTGPQMPWECTNCHVISLCVHRQEDVDKIKKLLPCPKKTITDAGMGAEFNRLKDYGTIVYNRKTRNWENN